MANVITTAIEFLQKVKEGDYVLLKFTKKDGSDRIMKATLNFDNIPGEQHPKNVDLVTILKLLQKKKLLHVFDVESNSWKSVLFESVQWLETIDKNKHINKYIIDSKLRKDLKL